MMDLALAFMASMRRRMRNDITRPPTRPTSMTQNREVNSAWIMTSRRFSRSSRSRPDEEAEAARQQDHLGEREMGGPRLVATLVGDLDQAGMVDHAGRQRGDVAGQRLAGEIGDEVERGARLIGAPLDGGDELPDAAGIVLLGQPVDLGLDRLADLRVEQLVHVPVDAAQHDAGPDGEDHEIGQRQLERRRPEQLTDDRHGSCIPPRGRCGAAAHRHPCRSWSAAARCARR